MTSASGSSAGRRLRRGALGAVSMVTVLGTCAAAFGTYTVAGAEETVTSANVPGLRGGSEPGKGPTAVDTSAMTVLLMGSDSRAGANGQYGKASVYTNARSDTAIVLHLYEGRKRALAMSIPRDQVVDIPSCDRPGRDPSKPQTTRFNAAFETGGIACSAKTVQEVTGIPIDHVMVIDFVGFKNVVDALGGVPVCLTKPVDDEKSKLKLPAGESVVDGEQALAFVRARKTLGDGSDLDRIKRQQQFLASLVRTAKSTDVLVNPSKLLSVVNAAAKSLTVDSALKGHLRDLALSVRDLKPGDVQFVTSPWIVNPNNPDTVVADPNKAPALWSAIATDSPYPPPPSVGADGKPLLTAPADIRVRVLNGSGVDGQGRKAAELLRAQGFTVVDVATAEQSGVTTSVRYNPAFDESARTLAYAVGAGSNMVSDGSGRTLVVTIGTDWTTVSPVIIKKPAPTSSGSATAKPSADAVAGTAADTSCSKV